MVYSKEEAKREIQLLVKNFKEDLESGKTQKMNEEQIKNEFIEPLFEALGWDIRNKKRQEEVIKEKRVLRGRADYAFSLNGVIRFFVEAKPTREGVENPEFAKQVIEYGFNKGLTWAVLTDFKSIKVFNCEWNEQNIWRNQVFELNYEQYANDADFDKLWFLSNESFQNDKLSEYATTIGKRTPRKTVSELLLNELMQWREKLSKNIKNEYPNKYSPEEIDETVQKLIDRLIFIRACEDREIEDKKLKEIQNAYKTSEKKISKSIKEIFNYYKERYDSKLFDLSEADKVDFNDSILYQIINSLYYSTDGNIAYDFAVINADILGNVYEQYLCHILKTSAKRAKLEGSKGKRKEEGIYYTPTYIVDYIVRNTLGELLKNKKPDEVKNIKILDPACGSGSFLLKAFDVLDEYYIKNQKDYEQTKLGDIPISKKIEIATKNIYGVDLDEKAIEITKLNLLLKMAEQRHLLPHLEQNIKRGNSLIDDPTVAGDAAFNWEEEFKEVIKEGGFDVVIGNPPWGAKIEGTTYFEQLYPNLNINSFCLFLYKGLNVLARGGILGFIIPKNFIRTNDYATARKLLLDKYKIVKIVDAGKFPGVVQEAIIIIIQNGTASNNRIECGKLDGIKFIKLGSTEQNKMLKNPDFIFDIYSDDTIRSIRDKIEKNSKLLGSQVILSRGIETGKTGKVTQCDKCKKWFATPRKNSIKKCKFCGNEVKISDENTLNMIVKEKDSKHIIPVIPGNQVTKYSIKNVLWMMPNLPGISFKNDEFFKKEKIVLVRILPKIIGTIDDEKRYTLKTLYNLNIKKEAEVSLKYILGVINSKLFAFYYEHTYNIRGNLTPSLTQENIKKFPIPLKVDKRLEEKVDKMLAINKRINEIGDKKTEERARIEEEIKKTDAEIDEMVYKLYGITEEEKKIIEESLK